MIFGALLAVAGVVGIVGAARHVSTRRLTAMIAASSVAYLACVTVAALAA